LTIDVCLVAVGVGCRPVNATVPGTNVTILSDALCTADCTTSVNAFSSISNLTNTLNNVTAGICT